VITLEAPREPWRLLFPLGALLAWAGALPWLLFSLDQLPARGLLGKVLEYRAFLHPIAELEGFVGCFALGLIFSFVKPSWPELFLSVAAPLCAAALAFTGRWQEGQLPWLLLLGAVVLRFRRGAAGMWLLAALPLGLAGFALASFGQGWWLRELGRDLILQGMPSVLAVGTARIIRGDGDGRKPLHALGLALFAAGFWISARYGKPHLGFALRGLVLIAAAWPLRAAFEVGPRNLHRSFAHLALWMTAAGTLWIGILPTVRRAGLHVIFLGALTCLLCAGFTRLGLSRGRLAAVAGLFSLSMFGRVMVELDPPSFHIWMGISAAAFLCATALCLSPLRWSRERSAAWPGPAR
jgi:hypothetical protein